MNRPSQALVTSAVSALLAIALIGSPAVSSATEPIVRKRIPVVILTGENDTNWRWTSTYLRQILEDSGKFDVEVALFPAGFLADEYYYRDCGVFVVDYAGQRWGEPAESNFLEAVKGGAGVVAFGAGALAFPEWQAYREVVGLASAGSQSALDFGPVELRAAQGEHPLLAGIGGWSGHRDLRGRGATPVEGEHQVLGFAREGYPGAETESPALVVGAYGEGRTVATPLGNVAWNQPSTYSALNDPQMQQLILRSVEWAATGGVTPLRRVEPNSLTAADRAEGWELLFDGDSTSGWVGLEDAGMPEDSWTVEAGCLKILPGDHGGDIQSAKFYDEFELELEWKVAEDAASALAFGATSGDVGSAHAFSFHDEADALGTRILRPAGEFNHARVVARRTGVEHWLNGVHLMTLPLTPGEWAAIVGRPDLYEDPNLSELPLSRIVLQDKGTAVWFRNLKIREIPGAAAPGVASAQQAPPVRLFDGATLNGWQWVSQPGNSNRMVSFEVSIGLLVTTGIPLGYLQTAETYGDFTLELDWRFDPGTLIAGQGGLLLGVAGEPAIWPRSLEVHLGSGNVGDLVSWNEFPIQSDRRRTVGNSTRHIRNMERRTGQWNHLELRLEGGELTVRVNGQVVNAATGVGNGSEGRLALESRTVAMQFREIVLTPLR